MRPSANLAVRLAAIMALVGVVGMLVPLVSSPTADAQEASLSARVSAWKSADGVVELCVDLRDAVVGETRQCPQSRLLTFARAPESRWLRSRTIAIAPETSLWVRARRVGGRLDVGLGLSVEGEARGIRARSWALDWETTPIEQWQRTSAVRFDLPVAPHPELWQTGAGIVAGARRLEVGQQAPEFRLPVLGAEDDSPVSLSTVRADRAPLTLLVFWASWAPFVGETLSVLGDLAESEDQVVVIGINVYEVADGAGEAFTQNYGTELLHLVDADGSVARHYRVDGVPELFVIDSEGIYRGVIRGAAPLTEILSAIYGIE